MALSLRVSMTSILKFIISERNSHVHWRDAVDYPQHLPRKDRETLWQDVINPRGTTLFRLHRKRLSPDWVVLVWMDVFPFDPLDHSHHCHCLCHHGNLLHLSCRLQLSCRHISSLRKLGFGSTIVLPEHARRGISTGGNGHVHPHDIRWGLELPWRCRSIANSGAMGLGLLWTKDSC